MWFHPHCHLWCFSNTGTWRCVAYHAMTHISQDIFPYTTARFQTRFLEPIHFGPGQQVLVLGTHGRSKQCCSSGMVKLRRCSHNNIHYPFSFFTAWHCRRLAVFRGSVCVCLSVCLELKSQTAVLMSDTLLVCVLPVGQGSTSTNI